MSDYQKIRGKNIWLWGAGTLLKDYAHMLAPDLSIAGVCDTDCKKIGTAIVFSEKKHIIQNPCVIKQNDAVIIAVMDQNAEKTIRQELKERKIIACHIFEAVDEYWVERQTEETEEMLEIPLVGKMMKFIDCSVPIDACNLNCDYCYIGQQYKFDHRIPRIHSPQFIRKAISRKRMGGTAFVNFCGVGETLLCKELLPIVHELIEEGHYVQIVTNATISNMIERYLNSSIDLSRLFFKCSFHYLQLKKNGLLEIFAKNVNEMREAGVSVSVEITPEDALIPYIDEIKTFCIKEFGALPHITVTRDERCADLRILSQYSDEEYKKIWSVFDSPMFDYKMEHRESQKDKQCMAGAWSIQLDLETGRMLQCVGSKCDIGCIFDLTREIDFKEVGKGCKLPYCYNNHAYLVLGVMPGEHAPTYCEMRDREMGNQEHWLNENMQEFFSQKLYRNNSLYFK